MAATVRTIPKPWGHPAAGPNFNELYPTEFRKSSVKGGGNGWFAKVDIPAGTCMRDLSVADGSLLRFANEEELRATGWDMNEAVHYSTGHKMDPDAIYFTNPGTQMNHADSTRTASIRYDHCEPGKLKLYTTKDIKSGEEMFNNYDEDFAPCSWFDNLQQQLGNIVLHKLSGSFENSKLDESPEAGIAAPSEEFDPHARLAESYRMMKEVQKDDPQAATKVATKLYDDWASKYDATLKSWGYKVPTIIQDLVVSNSLLPAYDVMDFACGTGLLGEALAEVGFGKIHGCDISKGSLDYIEAQKEGVYTGSLKVVDMNVFPYPYEDEQFMYLICGGSFSYADDPYAVFSECIRITRKGGFQIFTYSYNSKEMEDWAEAINAIEKLQSEGKWSVEHAGKPCPYGNRDAEIGGDRVVRAFVVKIS